MPSNSAMHALAFRKSSNCLKLELACTTTTAEFCLSLSPYTAVVKLYGLWNETQIIYLNEKKNLKLNNQMDSYWSLLSGNISKARIDSSKISTSFVHFLQTRDRSTRNRLITFNHWENTFLSTKRMIV